MSRTDIINKEELLFKTNNGLDIYYQEINNLKPKGSNYVGLCCLHKEKSSSFTVFPEGNWKCFGCGKSGDVFSLLSYKYGINYRQALEKVRDNTKLSPINPQNIVKITKKSSILAEFSDMPYTAEGAKYWNEYEIPTDFLIKKNVFQVKLSAVNGKIWKIPKGAIRYAYYSPDLDQTKFLTINVEKEHKWKSFNIPDKYLWYYHEYKDNSCDNLFVNKSVKDCLIFMLLGRCSIAVQSENAPTLLKNAEKINKIATNPYVTWGNDSEAKAQSIIATKETGWKWLNPPNYYLSQGINDFAELSKIYGLKMVERELKKKFI